MEWTAKYQLHITHIQPMILQQNTYIDRFNRAAICKRLSQHYLQSSYEVEEFATQWMCKYNLQRPNILLGGITPKWRLAMVAQ